MFGGPQRPDALIIDTGSGGGRVDLEGTDCAASHFRMALCWPRGGGELLAFEQTLEAGWRASFTELRAFPEEHPVVVTVPEWASAEVRQSVVRLLFDGFKATDVHVVNQQIMALDSASVDTGDAPQGSSGPLATCVVLDCGFDGSRAVGIRDRQVVECLHLDVGGRDVAKMIRGAFGKTAAKEEDMEAAVEHVKEEYCYVALDFDAEVREAEAGRVTGITQELADATVTIRDELFKAPEVFFRPSILGVEGQGVHELVAEVMNRDSWGAGYGGHIVLVGGSTLFHGFAQRLEKEVGQLQSARREIRVTATDNRDHAAYLGALHAARRPVSSTTWITQAEYRAFGPEILASKQS